jgi:hypothetical protein
MLPHAAASQKRKLCENTQRYAQMSVLAAGSGFVAGETVHF